MEGEAKLLSKYLIKNLSKTYKKDNKEIMVLKNINLEIDAKDITVIIGKSGCGKTTFIRLLKGLEEYQSGEILFKDDNDNYCEPKAAMVFQESRLMPWLNVKENILIHGKNEENLEKVLKLIKLSGLENAYPDELSGGMANRVSIGRALIYDPDILIMDEPFAALDYFTRMDMQKEVIKIYEETKKGVIFVTHNIEEAMLIATKIIVLSKKNGVYEFSINKGFNRDIDEKYFIELKKEILNILKE